MSTRPSRATRPARAARAVRALTTPDMVILSLLAERPMHGYDVSAELDRRLIRDWASVSRPQVYYSLEKLARLALVRVASDAAPAAGPERRVFATSAAESTPAANITNIRESRNNLCMGWCRALIRPWYRTCPLQNKALPPSPAPLVTASARAGRARGGRLRVRPCPATAARSETAR